MTLVQVRRNQKDAAIACAANIHPEDGHAFRVMEAPGPEEVLTLMMCIAEMVPAECWTLPLIPAVWARKQLTSGMLALVLMASACDI